MIPRSWLAGEIAVVGMGTSGRAVATLLVRAGARVYASDAGTSSGVSAAASALAELGVAVDAGHHDLARIARASVVVASPGVPPSAPPLAGARAAGTPVVGEVEVALHALTTTRCIAVTGTNGKTTTTALIAHLLRSLGHEAVGAGNIGTPLSEVALRNRHPEWVALELSSFQLHDTPSLDPAVGVMTNLSPDHLDRYASVAEYYADKALLFANASDRSHWVLNAGDPGVVAMAQHVRGAHHYFSTERTPFAEMAFIDPENVASGVDAEAGGAAHGGSIWWDGQRLLCRDELHLLGRHNVENAMAAALAVIVASEQHATPAALERIANGLRSFRALAHRLEVVGEYDGVLWINDSKATNVSSALVAVRGMTRPTVLLLGGRHKGESYTALAEPLARVGRAVIAYGEAAPIIEQDLHGVLPVDRLGADFERVMARARALARPGDVILLSPACSSYDMFTNYEERGAEFKRLARDGR